MTEVKTGEGLSDEEWGVAIDKAIAERLSLIRECLSDNNLSEASKWIVIVNIVLPVNPTDEDIKWARELMSKEV